MNYAFNIIRKAFEWGLFFALIGGLGEATGRAYKEAGHARAHGLISLLQFNRSLVGDAGLHRARTRSPGAGELPR